MASEQGKVAPPAEAPAVVVSPPETLAPEPEKGALPPKAPPPEVTPTSYLVVVEVVLRVLLFASTLTAVVVMVASKQTELIPTLFPPFQTPYSSKFTDSPALIYYVAALSVAGLHSIITTLLSGLALLKPGYGRQLVSHFIVVDVLLLGIVAAAIGAAGGVGYIALRGNSHSLWYKVCNLYDTFCQHLAGSLAAALFASILLVLLILLSFFTLSRKIPS